MAKFVVPIKMCWAADSVMAPPQQLYLSPADKCVCDGDEYILVGEEVVEVLEKPKMKKAKKRKWGDKK